MEGYGQTESSPVITVNPFDLNKICFGTVGMTIENVTVQLEHREGMAEGEGEILAKGPNIMMGYYKRPDLTAETVVDGWLRTGDVGTWVDYKGGKYLKITDRVKEGDSLHRADYGRGRKPQLCFGAYSAQLSEPFRMVP